MILVTGANGFVGSALTGRLARDGRGVAGGIRKAGTNLPPGVRPALLGDLQQPADLAPMLDGISVVVHTAARVHMLDDRSGDPLAEFRRVNVEGTLQLARQAARAGVHRFVFVSSIKVNGEATTSGRPFRPGDPPQPLDPYGVSKFEAESALRQLALTTGLEVVVVRPPLIYGPGVQANFRVLMRLLMTGWPLPFGAIDNRRSLVGIENLVELLIACIDEPAAAAQTFLVSDDEDVSTTALMRRLAKALGVSARLFPVPAKLLSTTGALFGQGERMRRMCESLQVDIAATRRVLRWSPRVRLDEGLVRTAEGFLRETSV